MAEGCEPGNANLPIGELRNANREIGVPGQRGHRLKSLIDPDYSSGIPKVRGGKIRQKAHERK
jgi:hypothetical protein